MDSIQTFIIVFQYDYHKIKKYQLVTRRLMIKQQLQIFARLKPLQCPASCKIPHSLSSDQLIAIDLNRNKMYNARDHYQFCFKQAFSQRATQEQIFQAVAKPVIDNCLDGYNGTIFAYGQTGSGKTYTMSGGDDWRERGIIPRVLSYIFEQFKVRSGKYDYQLNVSFIEIYNENAYDLLDQNHTENNFQSWTKIVFMEDQECNLQMKNVKFHSCVTSDQAINYSLMGNYNRKINATSLNQFSSRSHSIFTINVRGVEKNTLAQVFSKIHLVDLAGSQRISKSQAEGIVLTEAKSINLSLTYLEQVIVALQKSKSKSKPHIPYRNSLLTMLLKDSLGGNCKTVMIATISMESNNAQETVSTLRFSQRVGMIENLVLKNQKNVYANQIEALEKENSMLRKKLAKYQKSQKENQREKQGQSEDGLRVKVEEYMRDKNRSLNVQCLSDAYSCFKYMRQLYNKKMRQYATQLTFISQKLQKYQQILTRKQKSRQSAYD